MKHVRWVVVVVSMVVAGSLLTACGAKSGSSAAYPTQKEAIASYCAEKGIDIPELVVSGEKEVSSTDAN